MPLDGPPSVVAMRSRVRTLCLAAGLGEMRATRVATGCGELARAVLAGQPNFVFEARLEESAGGPRLRLLFQGVNHLPGDAGWLAGFFDRLAVRGEAGADGWLAAEAALPAGLDAAALRLEAASVFTLGAADRMLRVILPDPIAEELTTRDEVATRRHEQVAVLFADVVGFTSFCDGREPDEIVEHLQAFSRAFEGVCNRHGVEKIKTIGDCFMAAAGLPEPMDRPVEAAVACGLEMTEAARGLSSGWTLRMGIHVGPVIAGLVGVQRFSYDLWGDTVNTASRVESNGRVGRVNLSAAAYEAVRGRYAAESIGCVELKGKGAMELYCVSAPLPPAAG